MSITTPASRKRLALPLRGRGRISDNIRVVLDPGRGTASVRVPYDVRTPAQVAGGPAVGLDAGATEVLATSAGEKHGQGYGTLLGQLPEETTETGKARNKLFQFARKAERRGDAAKASRIRRNPQGQPARGQASLPALRVGS